MAERDTHLILGLMHIGQAHESVEAQHAHHALSGIQRQHLGHQRGALQ